MRKSFIIRAEYHTKIGELRNSVIMVKIIKSKLSKEGNTLDTGIMSKYDQFKIDNRKIEILSNQKG
jgi:hypothetical protein